MTFGTIVAVLVSGLVVGALARFAVPGPDPMPIWKTVLLGVAGSVLGGGVGYAVAGSPGVFIGSVLAATLLLILYRRLVERRPLTGPAAHRPPRR